MALTVTSLAITCVIICAIYNLVTWYMQRRLLYKKALKFEGPALLPFIGNAHLLLGSTEAIITNFSELAKVYSSPYRLWLGENLHIVVSAPEQLKAIYVSPKTVERGEMLDFARPWVGTGIVTAPAAKWRVHRRLIQPAFNQKILDAYVDIFATQAKIMCEKMEQKLDGPEFEINDFVRPCTLDIVCETAMGVKIGAQTDSNCCYMDAADKLEAIICKRMATPWLHPDLIFNCMQFGKNQRKYTNFLHTFANNVIQTKKRELESNSQPGTTDGEDNECDSPGPRKVFLDHLMKISNDGSSKFSDQDLREEVDTVIVAGYDSTVTTNSFLMLMLASHPDVQEKVYQELWEIYGDYDIDEREVRHEDLSRMSYLERVIKETTRLFPFFSYALRKVIDDLDIDERTTLPKGSTAILAILNLHRCEKYWPDSLKFDPDRFLPEEVAKRLPYTYMGFGAGPRNCIGSKYATMAMKTLQATILRRYILKKDNITPVKDIRLKLEIVLKPVVPITLRIERRIRK